MIKAFKKHIGKQLRDVKILRHHLKRMSFAKPSKKRIIVCFNGVVPHGGLVDRLKGIVSFYDIAKQLDYDFYIQFNNPFALDTFLQPNNFDWRIPDNEIGFSIRHTKLINLINNFEVNPIELIKASSKNTFLVYANIDYLSRTHKDKNATEIEHIWRKHFNVLFKKSDKLKSALAELEPKPYISIHTRFTSIMGDFEDSTSLIITKNEQEHLLDQLNTEVSNIQKKHEEKVYVFSDSGLFLNYITQHTNTFSIKGTPFHMDSYKSEAGIEAHLKTLIDFFMISESQEVYFLKINPMYNSAFSKYASIVGNKPFKYIDAS